jgi:hypothetical protein
MTGSPSQVLFSRKKAPTEKYFLMRFIKLNMIITVTDD